MIQVSIKWWDKDWNLNKSNILNFYLTILTVTHTQLISSVITSKI